MSMIDVEGAYSIPVDPNGKQILVINAAPHVSWEEVAESMQILRKELERWLQDTNDPIYILYSDNRFKVELIRVSE